MSSKEVVSFYCFEKELIIRLCFEIELSPIMRGKSDDLIEGSGGSEG